MKKTETAVTENSNVIIDLDELLNANGGGKGKGIGDFCRKTIVRGLIERKEWLSSKEVLAAVRAEFGENCATTEKSIAWYKSELRNDREKLKRVIESLGYTA